MKKTGIMLAVGTLAMAAAGGLGAQTLGDMARTGATDLGGFQPLIEIVVYLAGVVLIILSFIKFKRHNDSSRDQRLGGAVTTLLVGIALLALPAMYEAVIETFGVDETATIERPTLN